MEDDREVIEEISEHVAEQDQDVPVEHHLFVVLATDEHLLWMSCHGFVDLPQHLHMYPIIVSGLHDCVQ